MLVLTLEGKSVGGASASRSRTSFHPKIQTESELVCACCYLLCRSALVLWCSCCSCSTATEERRSPDAFIVLHGLPTDAGDTETLVRNARVRGWARGWGEETGACVC